MASIISVGFTNKVCILKLICALQFGVSTQEGVSYFRNKVHKWAERPDKPLEHFLPRSLLEGNPCSGWALKIIMYWSGICLVIDLQEDNVAHDLCCGKHFIRVFCIRLHRNTLHKLFLTVFNHSSSYPGNPKANNDIFCLNLFLHVCAASALWSYFGISTQYFLLLKISLPD